MDFGFIVVAMVVMWPFLLMAFGLSYKQRRQKELQLRKLLLKVGISPSESMEISRLQKQKDKGWYLWLSGRFKKAGIKQKKEIIKFLTIQSFLLILSLFVLTVEFHTMTQNQLLLIIILPFIPIVYLQVKINQRQKDLRKQFPEMLDSIVRSLQSGYGIDGAINAVGEDMSGPLAEEMWEVNKQLVLGISMRDILREFQRRVSLPEAQFFVITLIIQRETGGQLSAILSELAKLMRRREVFQAKLKTLTAESRFTAWFIGGAPVLYIGYKYLFDRESMQFFLHDPLGIKLFIFSIIMISIGGFLLKQMLKMRI